MSRRNWRFILATVGLIAAIGLSIETGKLYEASEQRQPDYDYQPASHPRLAEPVPGQPATKQYEPHCANPNSNSDSDLCAQWSAVQQVAETNRLATLGLRFTLFSLWATVIATVLLIFSLIESRLVSRRELRAYLFAEGALIGDGTHHPERAKDLLGIVGSVIAVKNSGSTPAHRVSHFSAVDIAYFKDEGKMRAPIRLESGYASNVSPGGSISADRVMSRKPTERMIAAIKAGRAAVFVYGAIEYLDVFDRKHRTDYRLFYTGNWPPPPNPVMQFSNNGNDAD